MCCALARRVGESVNLERETRRLESDLSCKAKASYIFHNGGNSEESTLSKISEHYYVIKS